MKKSAQILSFLIIIMTLFSCKSVVVSQPNKPEFQKVKLNTKYEFHLIDSSKSKFTVTKLNDSSIVVIDKKGIEKEIPKSEIREIKKTKIGASVLVAILAIASVIFVPI